MNTTDEIMAMADAFATAHRFRENSATNARATLKTAIKELVKQTAWAHHTPALLSEADMFWNHDDIECFGHDISEIVQEFGPGDIVKIDRAKRLTTITVRVLPPEEDDASGHLDFEVLDAADAAADLAGVARAGAEPVAGSLALNAALGYVERHTPHLVYAEIRKALAAPQPPQASQPAQDAADAERYRWLRDRFLGTDYAWGHRGTGVWVFETDAPVSVDPCASIDAAIAAQKGKP